MSAIAIVNGTLVDPAAPAVSVYDAAVLHGDAYFETLRTYDGRPALLGAHLARLAAAMEAGRFPDPPSTQLLEDEVAAAVNEFSEGDLTLRITVSRGIREQGFSTDPESTTRIVTARLLGPSNAGTDARVTLAEVPGYSFPRKSASYQPQADLMRDARTAGYDEVLVTDDGELIEGSTSNVFVLKDGELATPALGRCLPGVTRAAVLEIADSQGLRPVERTVSVDELAGADEIFITNSLIELRRVLEVNSDAAGGRDLAAVASLRETLVENYCESSVAGSEVA